MRMGTRMNRPLIISPSVLFFLLLAWLTLLAASYVFGLSLGA